MKNIYYVVQKQLDSIDGFEEANGWKNVSVLQPENDKINVLVVLEIHNTDNSELAILDWLDENHDFNEKDVKLIQL